MHLNPFAISNLLIVLTCLVFAAVVLIFGKAKISKIYSLQIISVMMWGLGAFFASVSKAPESSLFWWRFSYCGVLFIPVFFLHTAYLLTSSYNKYLLVFSYAQAIFFSILTMSGILCNSTKFMFNSFYYFQGGVLYFISFVLWVFLVLVENLLLIKFYIANKERQILLIILSALVGFGGGVSNFIPAFGISIYPFGNFSIPFYTLIMVYAILKYQTYDINIVIQKSFVYSVLVALITATFFVLMFLAEKFFQGVVGYTSLLVSVLYAFVIALFFNPVKNRIQRFADKVFLGKDPMQIARENELMKQELERTERLKTIAHFASGMAHEIKNPLTSIKTFSEYLPEKKDDPEFLNKFSKIVSREVDRIDSLVHQLLDFSKPAPLKLQDIDIHSLLDDTLAILNSEFIKYKIKIDKNYTLNAPRSTLKIDSNQIKQVFLNLFLNAIDAMPSGGTLTIGTLVHSPQTTDKDIDRGLSTVDYETVMISISDTGIGIAEKDLPHIFEPFYSKKEGGTGLGLSIVYNIIKEHKGSIKVESKVKEGTRFIIELPLV